MLVILSAPFVLYFLLWLLFARGLPSAESLLNYQPPLPTYVRDVDGEPVQSFARERRVQLAYDEFPPRLINAFLAAEDRTFFTHGGIDYPGLVGAVWRLCLQGRAAASAPAAARPSPSRSPRSSSPATNIR